MGTDLLLDRQLFDLLRQDNRVAFNQLYNRYWERLYRSAFNVLRDEEASKDIVQEIFLDLWRKRRTQQIDHTPAYLLQAVKFQVARHLRRGRLAQIHLEQIAALNVCDTTDDILYYNDLTTTIERSMNDLPEKCRDVFYLSRFERLSNREIAERLNLSIRTVEWHISNALKHLRHAVNSMVSVLIMIITGMSQPF